MKPQPDVGDLLSHQIGLEAQALEDFFIKSTTQYYNTPTILGKSWYALGLESNDDNEQKDQANKSHIVQRILEGIVNFIKSIFKQIGKFLDFIKGPVQADFNRRARELRKRRLNIDFANDIVKKIPESSLVVLCAIEENHEFTEVFDNNIKTDRAIEIPNWAPAPSELHKNEKAIETIEGGLDTMNELLGRIEAKEENRRYDSLVQALKQGITINGSENGDYLKEFTKNQDTKQKFTDLLNTAERFQKSGASMEVVKSLQKIANILSKQFAMEVRVVTAYTKLNRAVVEVNDKLFAK